MKKILVYAATLVCLAGSVYADITVKGILSLDTNLLINGSLTNTDWRGVDTEHKYKETYLTGTGMGLGAEYSFINQNRTYGLNFWPDNLEVLGGLNYFLPQSITDYKLKDQISPPDANGNTLINSKQSYADNELTIQITSFYIKPRYILPIQNFGPYIGLKLSYNLIGIGGENSEELKLDNTLGYGFSLGTIIDNTWDIELSLDKLGSINKNKDGETYELNQMLLTAGYRFGQTKPVKTQPVKAEKVKVVEEIKKEVQPVIPEPEQKAITPVSAPASSILDMLFEETKTEEPVSAKAEEIIEPEEAILIEEPEIILEKQIEQAVQVQETKVEETKAAVEEVIKTAETTAVKSASETAAEARQRMLERMQERKQ